MIFFCQHSTPFIAAGNIISSWEENAFDDIFPQMNFTFSQKHEFRIMNNACRVNVLIEQWFWKKN